MREIQTVDCGSCGARMSVPIANLVVFPDHAREVLALILGSLNLQTCNVCSATTSIHAPVAVIDVDEARAAFCSWPRQPMDEIVRTLQGESGREFTVATYDDEDELRAAIFDWWQHYVNRATAPLFTDEERVKDEDGTDLVHTPLVLLTLLAKSDGTVRPDLRTEPPLPEEEQREITGRILAAEVAQYVRRLYTRAFHDEGIATLLSLVEERIPADCVTPDALSLLESDCVSFEPSMLESPAGLDAPFRRQYLNAVAHAAAGRPNPRSREWAGYSLLLFSLSRQPNFEVPEAMLLDAAVLRRTIAFEDAWDFVAEGLATDDPERVETIQAWFEHLGWGERFHALWAEGILHVDLPDDTSDEELAERMLAAVAESTPEVQAEDADRDELRATAISMFAAAATRAGRPGVALAALEGELGRLAAADRWEQAGWLAIRGAEAFNAQMAYGEAAEIVRRWVPQVLQSSPPCELEIALLNELGNRLRYASQPSRALEVYDRMLELTPICEAFPERDALVLMRNRAIVLRGLGRFREAMRLLEEAAERTPADEPTTLVQTYVNLATTCWEANLFREALTWAEAACAIRLPPSSASTRVTALIAASAARSRVAPGSEVNELEEAMALATPIDPLRSQVAAVTVHLTRSAGVPEQVLAAALTALRASVSAWDGETFDSPTASRVAMLAEWEYENGDASEAQRLVQRASVAADGELPWQLRYLGARMLPEEDVAGRWEAMRRVLESLDEDVPDVSGVRFTTSWMSDKTDVQRYLLTSVRTAADAGVADLVEVADVFEFLNAREIGVGARGPSGEVPSAGNLLRDIGQRADALLLMFLESDERIDVLCARPATSSLELRAATLDPAELRDAAELFGRRISTCVLASQARRAEETIAPVLAKLGSLVAEEAEEGEHVCLLPCPSLLGVPLQAATLDGEPLLRRNTVSLAPNLATLGSALSAEAGNCRCSIAVVSKEGERDDYVGRSRAAGETLRSLVDATEVDTLFDRQATKEAVLTALRDSDHVIFIGHGTYAGATRGRGLCVSDGENLPRGPLDLELAPELARFVVEPADCEELPRTAATITSIACSSGRSYAGGGGTRIGLERPLLANGTRTIVAPIWDVHQETALYFVAQLYAGMRERPNESLATLHRDAVLEVREKRPALYHWAPFVLNGSWL